MKHKHAELIKAWADGAIIQFYAKERDKWLDCLSPSWVIEVNYRIKPEPKPDVVYYVVAEINNNVFKRNIIDKNDCFSFLSKHKTTADNLKLSFDGETGKLMTAEVL